MVLQVLGLALDLIGVAFLGIDLIRIQYGLRKTSQERIEQLNTLTEEYGGVEGWVEEIAKTAHWNEYADMGESIYQPIQGSFDSHAARDSFENAMLAVGSLAERIEKLSEIVLSDYNLDKQSANSSLAYSYIGLALIITGFSIQIISLLLL